MRQSSHISKALRRVLMVLLVFLLAVSCLPFFPSAAYALEQPSHTEDELAPTALGDPYLSIDGTVLFDTAAEDVTFGNARYTLADNRLTLNGPVGIIEAHHLGEGFTLYLANDGITVGLESMTMDDTALQVTGELIVDGPGTAELFGALVVTEDTTTAFATNGCFTKKQGTLSVLGAVTSASSTNAMVSVSRDILIEGGGTFFRGSTPVVLECGGDLKVTGGEYFYVISFSALGARISGNVDFLGGKNCGVISIELGDVSTEQYSTIKAVLSDAGFSNIEDPFLSNGTNTLSPVEGALLAEGAFTVDTTGAVQIFRIFDGFGLDGVTDITVKAGIVQIFSTGGFGAKASGACSIAGGDVLIMGIGGSGLELPGEVSFLNGNSTILGLIGSGGVSTGIYGLKTASGNVSVSGGNHTVVGTGMDSTDWGMYLPEGSLTMSGGKLLVIGPTEGGLVLDRGTIEVNGGTLEGAGAYIGMSAEEITISNGVANAFIFGRSDPGGSDWSELYQEYFNALKEGDSVGAMRVFLKVEKSSGSDRSGYGMISRGPLSIVNSTVTTLAFLNSTAAPLGSHIESIGIHADTELTVSESTVVALADTNASSSTTIGLHAGNEGINGSPGHIRITDSIVTAYAFQKAATRLAMYVEGTEGTIQIPAETNIAAGQTAPATQVTSYDETLMSLYPYVYASDGSLYLDDIYLKWDYLDQSLALDELCFDPPNGQLIITREMMQSLVGLDRFMILLSDNVGISKSTWRESLFFAYSQSHDLDPDNPEAPFYFSPAFKGTGVVFIFKTGRLAGKTSIHQVDGISFYDFGSRYDTNPEYSAFLRLTQDSEKLIHSVHFNYTDEYPADMQILLSVGEDFKNQPVSWYYLTEAKDTMAWILDQAVDPFGWLILEGLTHTWADTAITSPRYQEGLAQTGDDAGSLLLLLVPLWFGSMAATVCLSILWMSQKRSRAR